MNGVGGGYRPYSRFILGLAGLCSLACGGGVRRDGGDDGMPGGSGQSGGSATPSAGTGAGGGSADADAGTGAGGEAGSPEPGKGGPRLRVLTRSEYKNALTDLLGTISTPLALPDDASVAGFVSIGASQVTISATAVALYETASLAATAEVFADAARWQKLVGCQPKADLSDGCVVTFIQGFGKRAYRRDLDQEDVEQWAKVGREAAQLSSSAAQGLAAVTSGLLQSPNFLYRVETNELDERSGRLKYDGASMATRLAFLLTGHPPSEALLAAAAAGQLDSADGVQAAAAPLLNDPSAIDRMAEFFSELSEAPRVSLVQKSPSLFPTFNAAMQSSMLEATRLFLKNIVLAPGADVRSFYDSDQTFVDATLAPVYGVSAPGSGFMQLELGPETGRAGILGQAAVIAGHSQSDYTSPARRGTFILGSLLCTAPPPPPDSVSTILPPSDTNMTTRQRLERWISDPSCADCHARFDPLGFALEHFDSIGQYRATESGLTIDASGALDGASFDGEAELGATLRKNPRAVACLVSNFYRDANGRDDAKADSAQIDSLRKTLTSKGYAWRDLVAEFVTSDAFRSAPAAQSTGGDQ